MTKRYVMTDPAPNPRRTPEENRMWEFVLRTALAESKLDLNQPLPDDGAGMAGDGTRVSYVPTLDCGLHFRWTWLTKDVVHYEP